LVAVLGTQGGDLQPQVVLQLLARILRNGQTPGEAVHAPRWSLGDGGFSTWTGDGPQVTMLEGSAPSSWEVGLAERGHRVVRAEPGATDSRARRRSAGGCVRSTGDHRRGRWLVRVRRAGDRERHNRAGVSRPAQPGE
jgi:gamma-glutamyltranspeptidase/glutathione hydrolase